MLGFGTIWQTLSQATLIGGVIQGYQGRLATLIACSKFAPKPVRDWFGMILKDVSQQVAKIVRINRNDKARKLFGEGLDKIVEIDRKRSPKSREKCQTRSQKSVGNIRRSSKTGQEKVPTKSREWSGKGPEKTANMDRTSHEKYQQQIHHKFRTMSENHLQQVASMVRKTAPGKVRKQNEISKKSKGPKTKHFLFWVWVFILSNEIGGKSNEFGYLF